MTTERFRRAAAWTSARLFWIVPLLAVALCIPATASALYVGTYAALGRDQGIFQYVAWSLRHGARAYRDFHEINGPLPHAWNVVMQTLGGEDEHVFRALDTSFTLALYAAAATTLPRWVGVAVPARTLPAWALAGAAILGTQFVKFDWWHTNQREGFYAALILGSLALQAAAHHTRSVRNASLLLGAAACATSLTWFGKPPCATLAVLQVAVLVFDRQSLVISLKRALAVSALGALVSATAMIGFVAAYGDLSAALRVLSAVPLLHHTIWNRSIVECYWAYDNAPRLNEAMISTALFLGGYVYLRLPRQALLALVLPVGGFVVFASQGKGFPYHLQIVTLGTAVMQLVLLVALAKRGRERGGATALVVAVLALGLGLKVREDARLSPAAKSDWASAGRTKELRASGAYFERFPWGDFFLGDLHDAATFVSDHTRPDDRIQTYGLDPYFLFLARRHTATPVIYNFELNVDPALEGGSGARPSAEQRTMLVAHRDAAEQLVLREVTNAPPAAFVFFDKAPFGHPDDGELDFAQHCPEVHRFVEARYQPAVTFGTVRVRLLAR